jgi:hypothetical protein
MSIIFFDPFARVRGTSQAAGWPGPGGQGLKNIVAGIHPAR